MEMSVHPVCRLEIKVSLECAFDWQYTSTRFERMPKMNW